jgi:hypothetical protein
MPRAPDLHGSLDVPALGRVSGTLGEFIKAMGLNRGVMETEDAVELLNQINGWDGAREDTIIPPHIAFRWL